MTHVISRIYASQTDADAASQDPRQTVSGRQGDLGRRTAPDAGRARESLQEIADRIARATS